MSAEGPRAIDVSKRYRARSFRVGIARNLMVLVLLLAGCPIAVAAPRFDAGRPNIVFVLADDLTPDLLRYMPNVQRLEREGTSFDRSIVSASLCCPSRATILTGQLPHNTGVRTNIYPHGGLFAFRKHHDARRTFARALSGQGYRTALMGKYLNGYAASAGIVPPGWSDWAATAKGYLGFDYTLNLDGVPTYFGENETDYLTDVIAERGARMIDTAERPFFLELAPFTPHAPAIPALRHRGAFPDLQAPRGPAFNLPVARAPRWLAGRAPRTQRALDNIDALYRQRARSVLAIDELVGRLRDRLEATGELSNTYIIFSSDNGFHMGEHRMLPGKLTAFDTDIRVPLIVRGPRVTAGRHIGALTQNSDLAPTFEALAGALPRRGVDGRSLAGMLQGGPVPADWRRSAVIEHRHTRKSHGDPDAQTPAVGDPPTYEALRTAHTTYVEYTDGEREFYDLRTDPAQMDNAYADLPGFERRHLHRQLARLVSCRGTAECATAPGSRAARAGRGRRHRRRR